MQYALILFLLCILAEHASAQLNIPSSADILRVQPSENVPLNPQQLPITQTERIQPNVDAPEGADALYITLNNITLNGVNAYPREQIKALYQDYIGQSIPLSLLWEITSEINALYQEDGYFLSRAYIPEQDVSNGNIIIDVVEGYIGDVEFIGIEPSDLMQEMAADLKQHRPITIKTLESAILRFNDIPGRNFIATLKTNTEIENSVALVLQASQAPDIIMTSVDNYSSRFLGPITALAYYKTSIIPNHGTTFTVNSSVASRELRYLAVEHTAPISRKWNKTISYSGIKSRPGFNIASSDIRSNATTLGATLEYVAVRQRDENLRFSVGFEAKNSNSDLLGDQPLTRDRIRTLKFGLNYDSVDALSGYDTVAINFTKGLDVFSSSDKGDPFLSRAQANPDFRKVDASFTRNQYLSDKFVLISAFSGQWASDPLFSSEEFGFGGQGFGRAYDPSEITGDHGLKAAFKLQYLGYAVTEDVSLGPYGFYDIGKVWNKDLGNDSSSASSMGFGFVINTALGLSADLALAFPISRNVTNPQYGDGDDPRFLLGLKYQY